MGELSLSSLGSALDDGWKDDVLRKQMQEEALCDELAKIKALVRATSEGNPAVICTAHGKAAPRSQFACDESSGVAGKQRASRGLRAAIAAVGLG